MRETCHEVLGELGLGDDPLFKLAMALEKIALEDEYFVSRKLYPNVDFYSGIVQKAIGIPVPLFTAIFALARTVGWIAQLNEMIADPEYKIGRPRQLFTGATRRSVKSIGERSAQPGGNRRAGGRDAKRANERRGRTMSTHAGIRIGEHAVRRQRSVHRGAVRALPRQSGRRERASGGRISTRCAAGASDVAHAPIIQSFIELGKHRKVAGAMVDASTMRKQVLVLRLISKFRTLGMFHADLDPLKRQESALHRGSRPRELRLHAGRPRHGVRRRLVQGRHRPDAARRPHRRARGDVLPHARRRVHVHLGHADQALHPGAAGADSRAADVHRPRSSGTSWSG